jgi:uncharacterized protein
VSTPVATRVGTFVWHEHLSSDPKQAQDFYTQLFGWETEVWKPGEMDYMMISSGGKTHGGFFKAPEGVPNHWIGHVLVDSADETAEKVKAAGGTILMDPMDIPEVGRFAPIADPQGAVVSAFQPAGDGPTPEGVFVWDELGTQDVEAAERFYGAVFGWTSTDMGEEYGGYKIFQIGETRVAGAMKLRDSSAPSGWAPYIAVDDADATVDKGKKLGGSALLEPMDVPAVGRIAVLSDPQGAVFGIIKPES